jgi:putative copper resistance protein D
LGYTPIINHRARLTDAARPTGAQPFVRGGCAVERIASYSFRVPFLYWVAVTVHVISAMLWLGGMLFLAAVGAPVLRAVEPPVLRQGLFRELRVRFRTIGWAAIGLLVATGVLSLHYRGWLHWDGVLAEPAFWGAAAGRALGWKLGAVAVMVAGSAAHDFVLGPAASRAPAGSPEALRLRRWAALLARANAIVGLVVVAAAVRLARG